MKKILIIGATSGIATACARLWAAEGAEFFLVGRNSEKLNQVAQDLAVRGAADVYTHAMDCNEFGQHEELFHACFERLKQVDIALIAHGSLSNQKACEMDVQLTLKEFSINCLSVISLLTLLSNRMEKQQSGTIAVISSVAGERGRSTSYVYCAAKAAVSTFCDGLRGRMHKCGVNVLTIKPGYVDTPMIKDLPLPKILVASPEKVAKIINHAIDTKRNTIYAPGFWRWIMMVVKSIPESIFKRISI